MKRRFTSCWEIKNPSKSHDNPLKRQDLKVIDYKFHVNIIQPGKTLLLYDGSLPYQKQDILFLPGLTLFSFSSRENYNCKAVLNNLVFEYTLDPIFLFYTACKFLEEDGGEDEMKVGKGYWIYSNTECVWEMLP